jgi:hypothetical protein
MSTILLLEEKTKPADRVARDLVHPARHAGNATPGCTCDRWGHPCPDCVEPRPQARTTLRKFSLVKK